ncbi:MAG: glycogen synthase [Candidatus Helarchaeota archaeon]
MKILFVTSELVPYAKVGGLADVSGALPKTLAVRDHEIQIMIPKYATITIENTKIQLTPISYNVPDFQWHAQIERLRDPTTQLIVNFLKCDHLYKREEIYGNYEDNAERAIYFSKAALEFLKYSDWKPEIIHCNDWQTALIPILLKELYIDPEYQLIRTLLTIHNLAYQGIFAKDKFKQTGLNMELFSKKNLEYWGKVNFLKLGILYADLINTVSPKYATEIQTKEYGFGLEQYLYARRTDLYGILNGIDYTVWDPASDPLIWMNYDKDSLEKKQVNKKELQKFCNLPLKDVPLIGMISRLVDQKGFDLLEEIVEPLMKLNFQLVLLGMGDLRYHELFSQLQKKYPSKTSIFLKFDNNLAHKIEAGADFFLMPSKYEPCGLNQLISLRYGTIPIVRHTGGLADSIQPIQGAQQEMGTGFVFYQYDSQQLLQIIKEALTFYRAIRRRIQTMRRGMERDFSWTVSAHQYEELYKRALQKI